MKRITIVILCQLVLFCSFAVERYDTIKSVQIFQEMNKLFKQLGKEFPEDEVIAEVHEFEVPAELINILPGRSRMIGNASCFLTPFYATIKFDTLKGGNDGKGYSFTIALNIENSDIQDTDIKVHREMQTQFFEMELQSVKKGIHPENGEKLSDIKTRDWGAGGSYKWTAQWDGEDLIRYSSYYTGKVDDVYFNMDVDGDDISVPEEVADKLASLAKESLTYKSLRSRIIKK